MCSFADGPSSGHLDIFIEGASDLIDHELLLCGYQIGLRRELEAPVQMEHRLGILKVKTVM